MNHVTTAQAAARLGVTQVAVRKLIGTGQLISVGVVGRVILLDADSVEQLARVGTRHGRPWTEENAWAALLLLSGNSQVEWVGSTQLSRLRRKLTKMEPAELPILARRRALVHRYRGTTDVVQRLRGHVLATSAAAMADDSTGQRFGLTGGAGIVDGYVMSGDAGALKEAYGLIDDREGNVVLREVVTIQAFTDGVPLAAIALDLMESPATRERNAGLRILEELLSGR
ncbi:DNA-binding protein [Paenarthrobacter sp. RAF54_2]|uniref:helix-turn-helix domain-containing protein n=1 Tax=Paenarthrobacter sp. RAF54_2 TaxID=3233061 RepID=UPI003F961217